MATKLRDATVDSLRRAWSEAVKNVTDNDGCIASSVDAGFVIPIGQKGGFRQGLQVFVRVSRFSEELLRSHPATGGLLEAAQDLKPGSKRRPRKNG